MRLIVLAVLIVASSQAFAQSSRIIGDLPREAPPETTEGLDTTLGVLVHDGLELRTFVTKPTDAQGRLAAILFVSWVSCNTTEFNDRSAVAQGVRLVAQRSGRLMMRVDKPGVGDSEGDCSTLDYDAELDMWRTALNALRARDDVDPDRIVLWGRSMGSTMAPLVAAETPVQGLIADGGGALTWFERQLAFDRHFLERRGYDRTAIAQAMREQAAFQHHYLNEGIEPEAVLEAHPDLEDAASRVLGLDLETRTHYGRPFAYHQQAATKNWLGAWIAADAPALVFWSEFDQWEERQGAWIIADTLNKRRPGSVRLVELLRYDHNNTVYATTDDAHNFRNGAPAPEVNAFEVLDWLATL